MSINGKRKKVKCKNCGKEMLILNSILKTGRKKYCSKKCYTEKMINGKIIKEKNNPNWKGEATGYSGKHSWIYRVKGNKRICEHCGRTDKKKYEWANIDHKYRRVLSDYKRLCTSCHRIYDLENGLIEKRVINKLGQFICNQ